MPSTGPDHDLARLLPEAPPRPDRREAAIAEAMRRFDGHDPAQAPGPRGIRWKRPDWSRIGRPQMGVLMSMAVVAIVAAPVALELVRDQVNEPVSRKRAASGEAAPPHAALAQRETDDAAGQPQAAGEAMQASGIGDRTAIAEPASPPPAPSAAAKAAPQAAPAIAPAASARADAPPPPAPPPPPPPPPPPSTLADAGEVAANLNRLPQFPVPAARASAAANAAGARQGEGITVTGSRISRPDMAANSPVATVRSQGLGQSARMPAVDEEPSVDIVVTGNRISAAGARAARRGDWNACTVNDPDRRLDRCRRELGLGAKGDAGRAAQQVAQGLSRAWEGDTDGAVTSFDAAIATDPKHSFAYLNRGMLRNRLGEPALALQDFDQVVRYAPTDPRGYYHRSLAYRALGDDKRERADATRAVNLDARYRDLFD